MEEQQEAGPEAVTLARRALEINAQLFGTESLPVAAALLLVASVLDHFNGVDDNEALRLYEQAIAIFAREEGGLSLNLAISKNNLGAMYVKRSETAQSARDLDRCMANLELALPHLREAGRIFRATNRVDSAEKAVQDVLIVEENLRRCRIARTATAAASPSHRR